MPSFTILAIAPSLGILVKCGKKPTSRRCGGVQQPAVNAAAVEEMLVSRTDSPISADTAENARDLFSYWFGLKGKWGLKRWIGDTGKPTPPSPPNPNAAKQTTKLGMPASGNQTSLYVLHWAAAWFRGPSVIPFKQPSGEAGWLDGHDTRAWLITQPAAGCESQTSAYLSLLLYHFQLGFCRLSAGIILALSGERSGPTWDPHTIHAGPTWAPRGTHVMFRWDPHTIHAGPTWDPHTIHAGPTWDPHTI
nr:unnamed protein product [Digitaria exilis]